VWAAPGVPYHPEVEWVCAGHIDAGRVFLPSGKSPELGVMLPGASTVWWFDSPTVAWVSGARTVAPR